MDVKYFFFYVVIPSVNCWTEADKNTLLYFAAGVSSWQLHTADYEMSTGHMQKSPGMLRNTGNIPPGIG